VSPTKGAVVESTGAAPDPAHDETQSEQPEGQPGDAGQAPDDPGAGDGNGGAEPDPGQAGEGAQPDPDPGTGDGAEGEEPAGE
jgi:hypothetical protein